MVKTLTIKTEIPAGRKLEIQLPEDVPAGPAEIALVVVTPQTNSTPQGEPYGWARYCLENTIELERTDYSTYIEDFTERRF